MSKMHTDESNAKTGKQNLMKKQKVHHKKQSDQEEFGAEFDVDMTFARGKVDTRQPVSERTAWH